MSLIDAVVEALTGVAETIAVDGVTGFVPLLTIARLLVASGDMQDKGHMEPTRRQLQHLRGTLSHYPQQFEIKVLKGGVYLRLLW